MKRPKLVSTITSTLVALVLGCEPPPPPSVPAGPPPVVRLRLLLSLASEAAVVCDEDCSHRHAPGTTPFYECFAACPGAEADDEATCGEGDVRPKAACYMVEVITEPTDDLGPPAATGPSVIAGILQTSVSAATKSANARSPSRPRIRPAAPAPAPAARASASPSVVPAPTFSDTSQRRSNVPRDAGAP